MNTRTLVLCLGLPATLLASFYLMARTGQFGSFAKSPQEANLWLGGSVVVAGGRAKLWFREVGGSPVVEVSCKDTIRIVELSEDEPSEEVCGVRLKTLKFSIDDPHPPRLKVQVTWDQKD